MPAAAVLAQAAGETCVRLHGQSIDASRLELFCSSL